MGLFGKVKVDPKEQVILFFFENYFLFSFKGPGLAKKTST